MLHFPPSVLSRISHGHDWSTKNHLDQNYGSMGPELGTYSAWGPDLRRPAEKDFKNAFSLLFITHMRDLSKYIPLPM